MPSKLSNTELIQLVEDIGVRQVIHEHRGRQMLTLATLVRNSIVWRTTLHSDVAAGNVWGFLEGQGVVMEDLMSMTSAFKFRAGRLDDETYMDLAESLGWSQGAKALPKEISTFSSTDEGYKRVLRDNPWLCFLYLMSMSDLIARLDALLPKRNRPSTDKESSA